MLLQTSPLEVFHKETTPSIFYGSCSTPFGRALLFIMDEKISGLYLTQDDPSILKEVEAKWKVPSLTHDPKAIRPFANALLERPSPLQLIVRGTPLQVSCWKSLLDIPFGEVSHYEEIAKRAGYSKATRAIASAVAKNPISLLIPCHRVLYKSGKIGNYRWGSSCKKKILEWESSLSAKS